MQRPVRIVIPFKLENAKSRLAPVLSPEERQQLALTMLKDVLDAVSGIWPVTILSRPGFGKLNLSLDAEVMESDLELNDALNAFIKGWQEKEWPTDLLIVMADLAILTSNILNGFLDTQGDVVLSPGRGGGTNMILIRKPEFRTCYNGVSFPKHLDFARMLGLSATTFDSFRASCDIDQPSDLSELLIHGQGATPKLLRSWGFRLSQNCPDLCVRNAAIKFSEYQKN